MDKNIENLKQICRSNSLLEDCQKLTIGLKKLIDEYKYVWNIDLLKPIEISESIEGCKTNHPSKYSKYNLKYSKFILVSNNLDDVNKILNILIFKENKKFKITYFEHKFRLLKILRGFPVIELIED